MGPLWTLEKTWTYISWALQVFGALILLVGFFVIPSPFLSFLFMISGAMLGVIGGIIGSRQARLEPGTGTGSFLVWTEKVPAHYLKYLSWMLYITGFAIFVAGVYLVQFSSLWVFIIGAGLLISYIGNIIRRRRF